MRGTTNQSTNPMLEIERKALESRGWGRVVEDRHIDVTPRVRGASGDASEQVGRDNVARLSGKELAQRLLYGRGRHAAIIGPSPASAREDAL